MEPNAEHPATGTCQYGRIIHADAASLPLLNSAQEAAGGAHPPMLQIAVGFLRQFHIGSYSLPRRRPRSAGPPAIRLPCFHITNSVAILRIRVCRTFYRTVNHTPLEALLDSQQTPDGLEAGMIMRWIHLSFGERVGEWRC